MTYSTAPSLLRPAHRSLAVGLGLAVAGALTFGGSVRAQQPILPSSSIGDASSQPSGTGNGSGVVAPGGATSQFLVTTENSAPTHDNGTVSGNGTGAVPVATLANYVYEGPATVAYNAGNAGTEGSAYEFTLNVTNTSNNGVRFTYNFATSEDVGGTANPDFAFFTLTPVNSAGQQIANNTFGLLGSAGDAAANFSAIVDPQGRSPFNLTEGYQTLTLGVLPVGQYVLALGVADANTFDTQSGLFIGSVTQVPEPSTWALLGAGAVLGGVAWSRRRRTV